MLFLTLFGSGGGGGGGRRAAGGRRTATPANLRRTRGAPRGRPLTPARPNFRTTVPRFPRRGGR